MHSTTYVFRVRTKSGQVIGNITVAGRDQSEAETKLRERYPDCEILSCQVR